MAKDKNKQTATSHVVIFVERDTDVIFFKQLMAYYQSVSRTPVRSYQIVNIKGVSRYGSSKILGKIRSEIKPKLQKQGKTLYAVGCSYDTDVFEYAGVSIVDWSKLEKDIRRLGAKEFCRVEVSSSIEDWLLDDKEGICAYLKIGEVPTSLQGNNGYKKLINLFKRAGMVYFKGVSTEGMITALDLGKIRAKRNNALQELETILNVNIDNKQ